MLNKCTPFKCYIVGLFSLILISFSVSAAPKATEGLKLQYESDKLSIYLIPGINFNVYKTLKIENASVEFNDKWLRKYNHRLRPISSRIKADDINAIENRVSKQFNSSFVKEIEKNGNLTVNQNDSEITLLIKPAITGLIIKSPVKIIAGSTNKKVRTAGSATLVSEIYDNSSGILLGRIIDKQNTKVHEQFKLATRSFNETEFIPVYESWAKNLQIVLSIKKN